VPRRRRILLRPPVVDRSLRGRGGILGLPLKEQATEGGKVLDDLPPVLSGQAALRPGLVEGDGPLDEVALLAASGYLILLRPRLLPRGGDLRFVVVGLALEG
jgi:hypothetical protein